MTGSILLLIVCYALLALLVLALCLYTRWSFWIKTFAILAVTGFYFLSYDALTGMLGFPTPGQLPDRFVFHFAVVAQPNKATGEKGSIYLWATALGKDGPAKEPRAYEIPYEKETTKQLTEAQRRGKEGIVQIGQALEPEVREGVGAITRLLTNNKTQRLKLSDMPDPALPEK
jgi:hypothetical protein